MSGKRFEQAVAPRLLLHQSLKDGIVGQYRRRLPAIACERARVVAGREFPFERVTIIGDTPLDVDCARACGAVAVAVATGQHPRDELAACAPDHIFTDFTDVPGAVAALTGSAR